MTVEDVLKGRMRQILLRETPYVLEEARFGMFDLAAYVPEDCAFEGLTEAAPLSAVRLCNYYLLDGTCSRKKKELLAGYVPEYDEQALLAGFRELASDRILPEKEFNALLADRRQIRKKIACDAAERACDHLIKRIAAEEPFGGFRLRQGLHLLEFKSDHDDVNRFLEQLPHYAMLADYVWLVLGARQKAPRWLPSYVGLFREDGEGFRLEKASEYQRRLPPLSEAVLREQGIPERLKGEALCSFLRKWFINSIFYRAEGLVVPMDDLDPVLVGKEEKGRQSRLF